MKVLVTGGCGFIGGHLCELLVKNGHTVTALDDLSTGSLKNVESLKRNKSFSFVKGTICNARLVDRLVKDADAVFHLASVVGVKLVCDEPVRTIETMADGTSVVIKACRKYMKKVFVGEKEESNSIGHEHIGRVARVVETVRPDVPGRILLGDAEWSGRAATRLEPGTEVRVVAQENLTLVVERV